MYKLSRAKVQATSEIDYFLRLPKNDQPIVIFLHGFGETLGHLLRHFENKIPKDFGILAINGVFPLPQKNFDSPDWKLRFCWYFYDAAKCEYFINQRYPSEVISNLVKNLNLEESKKIILGYSQGGYLAPFLGLELKNVKHCISINGEYKHQLLPNICPFPITNICGENDEVVNPLNCQNSHQMMIDRGNVGEFHLIKQSNHQIDLNIIQTALKTIEKSNS